MQRIVSGIPRYGVDIRERDLPQETEQARALNFNKGCYVGQEIVERIRSRGAVHRKFTGFVSRRRGADAAGDKDCRGGKRSWRDYQRRFPAAGSGEKTVALGYIRREVGVPGHVVTIGSAKATVVQLPVTDERYLLQDAKFEQVA